MRYLIFAFLLVTSSHIFSQSLKMSSLIGDYNRNGEIEGVVLDGENENEPLFFAEVVVKGTDITTVTEIDGSFKISLKPGKYSLVFSFTGYKSIEVENVEVLTNSILRLDQVLNALNLKMDTSISEINTI